MTDTLTTADLTREVMDADNGFYRLAVPTVYAEYVEYVESGRFPYIDSVVAEIVRKYDLVVEVDRSPGSLYKTGLGRKLCHEVYLASGEHRVAEMTARESELLGEGFRPITELVPEHGSKPMKIQLAGRDTTYRLVYGFGYKHDEWALLEPRKRTHGMSLKGLVDSHRNFEEAKAAGNTSHNNPQVVMFKVVP